MPAITLPRNFQAETTVSVDTNQAEALTAMFEMRIRLIEPVSGAVTNAEVVASLRVADTPSLTAADKTALQNAAGVLLAKGVISQ